MDSFATKIETLEHQWMRAWIQRDRKAMKALASRDFIFLMGGTRAAILDRPSWLDGIDRFRCESYRFGEVYVRRHGATAVFACQLTIEAKIGRHELSGQVWVTDLWQRGKVRRGWKLIERVLSRPDADETIPAEIRELQLWR
ncbi:DUF4440 domain-containing protein [Altererythrobacter salegens]|uniref:DUF4440 domain-containing protein n=1 Tax=Croceibacterium salegens TaxID=1737568 RepID=A0A6I4SVJ8_9SPHN|nr:nuclear transport factor 2 family protein [Croceibacterium salegens]MXO59558.1 DUF4440 domain-containing protein [Croceibacterium salegens]